MIITILSTKNCTSRAITCTESGGRPQLDLDAAMYEQCFFLQIQHYQPYVLVLHAETAHIPP